MSSVGGYAGKILHVDLSKRNQRVEELSEGEARAYIGGSGLAAKRLWEMTGNETDPLGPENVLIFMTGPFTGTKVPLSGRHEVVGKSPLTGIYGESDVGGRWGTELKKAGFDGVVITGKSAGHMYLWINEDGAELRDADHLWGLDTYEASPILRKETDQKAIEACIGPAGERLARIAAIMHDGRDARAAGRCGLGAVMGSKNLKAIVAKGDKDVAVVDASRLTEMTKKLAPDILKNMKRMGDYGTSSSVTTFEELGDLPARNWKQGSWKDGAEKLSGVTMAKSILKGKYFCGACIVGCGRSVAIDHGEFAGVEGAGPEYETMALLGSNTLVDDLGAVAKAHELCNRYGLDVISTGGVIGFALEAAERGILKGDSDEEADLAWGNGKGVVNLVEKIGRREGLGHLLGEGVMRTSAKLGRGSEAFAIHVKGLEPPGHDPRAYNSLAVGYATSNRGACHLQGMSYAFERAVTMPELGLHEVQDRFGTVKKGELVAKTQDLMSLFDSIKLCKFLLYGGVKLTHILEWFNAVTGWEMSQTEIMRAGERIYNLKRMYNVRCGITRKDDTAPTRMLREKRGEGGAAENLPPFSEALDEYYRYRGWDQNGIPTKTKLLELGLADAA
ncbi:MAG: aldehyde ferredoxin oxidoreductase family protein [Candidatus Bathyarchaeia archaeon]